MVSNLAAAHSQFIINPPDMAVGGGRKNGQGGKSRQGTIVFRHLVQIVHPVKALSRVCLFYHGNNTLVFLLPAQVIITSDRLHTGVCHVQYRFGTDQEQYSPVCNLFPAFFLIEYSKNNT